MKKDKDKTVAARSWLRACLEGWGLSQSWAAIVASALIGAAAAVYACLNTGCVLSPQEAQQVQAAIRAGSLFLDEEEAATAKQVGELIIITDDGK